MAKVAGESSLACHFAFYRSFPLPGFPLQRLSDVAYTPGIASKTRLWRVFVGQVKEHIAKVKLFFGILASSQELLETARQRLAREFSPLQCCSEVIAFTHTSYYEAEMGGALLRQWVSTTLPIPMSDLVSIKLHTNRLEAIYAEQQKRCLNLDPGYVALSKVVLATTKDYDHRIYVDRGIYEEVTLHYRRPQGFVAWPWTYPDYVTETALRFFLEVRQHLRQELHS